MKVETAEREFRYNGVKLKDPNPADSLEKVREFYATIYPEIVSAAIEGPENIGNKLVYDFRKAVGTKGAVRPWREMLTEFLATNKAERVTALDMLNACTGASDADPDRPINPRCLVDVATRLGWKRTRGPGPARKWGYIKDLRIRRAEPTSHSQESRAP